MFNIPCYYFFSRYVSGVFLYLWLFLASPHHHLSLLRHDQPPSRPGKSSSIKPIFVIKSLNPCVWMPFSWPSWWIKMSMIIMVVLPRPELAAPALSRWGTRKEWEIHLYFQLFKGEVRRNIFIGFKFLFDPNFNREVSIDSSEKPRSWSNIGS